jgi:hypothetical protein
MPNDPPQELEETIGQCDKCNRENTVVKHFKHAIRHGQGDRIPGNLCKVCRRIYGHNVEDRVQDIWILYDLLMEQLQRG